MADVFVSYAKEDADRASKFISYLEACGWSVFWDDAIRTKENWRTRLEKEIEDARCVVVLWSARSVESDWVKEEAEIARRRRVSISVLIDDVSPPLGFATDQAVNLIGWKGGRHPKLSELGDAVAETVDRPQPVENPAIPPVISPEKKAVLGAVGALVLMGGAVGVNVLLRPAPFVNQEIVIDSSAGMAGEFADGKSRLAAAQESLGKLQLHPEDNLALRSFGAPCYTDDASELLVSFGRSRREPIQDAAARMSPSEKPTLAAAVISALNDVAQLENAKRVVVLAGHADGCHEDDIAQIKNHLQALRDQGKKVEYEFRLVGLNPSAEDRRRMQNLVDSIGGDFYPVATSAELDRVLQHVLVFEPSMQYVRSIWGIVSQIADVQNELVGHLNGRRFDEAETVLASGLTTYRRLETSFDALEERQISPDFQTFYDLAAENRALQARAFDAGRALIRQGRAEADVEVINETIAEWNDAIDAYNANHRQMTELSQKMAEEARNQ